MARSPIHFAGPPQRPQVKRRLLGGILNTPSMPLDKALADLLRSMIRNERHGRSLPATDVLRSVQNEFATRGALGHGRFPMVLDRRAAEEYEARATRWLAIASRAFEQTATPWTSDRSTDVRHLLDLELGTDWEDLITKVRQVLGAQSSGLRVDELENAKNRARDFLGNELGLLVLRTDRTRIPVAERLQAPRYAAILAAWSRAHGFMDPVSPDCSSAVTEAVGAVEQLARIVTRSPNGTLGDAIKQLRQEGRVAAPLLKGLEELWGWASNDSRLRHGAAATPLPIEQARYGIALAEAALGLLLTLDAT